MKKRFLLKTMPFILSATVFSQNVYAFSSFIKPCDIYDINTDGEVTASDAANILNYVLFGTSDLTSETQQEIISLAGVPKGAHLTANNAASALYTSLGKEAAYLKKVFNFSTLEKGEYNGEHVVNEYLTLVGTENSPVEVAERDVNDQFYESYPLRARLLGGGEIENNYIRIALDRPAAIRILASPGKMVSTMEIFNTPDKYGRWLYLYDENFQVMDSFNRWYESNNMDLGIRTAHLYTDNVLEPGTYYLGVSTEHGIDIEEIGFYEF